MNVSSIEFVVPVLAAAAVFFHLPTVAWRQAAYACCNALVVWLLLHSAWSGVALVAFLGSGYLAARALQARPSRLGLAAYLTLLVAGFVVLKQYDFLRHVLPVSVLSHTIRIVGLSYMLFRQIHFLVDVVEDQAGEVTLWTYLNYQLNLFAIVAGPIQRYQDFRDQWRSLEPVLADPNDLLQNCLRLLAGVFKIALVAPFLLRGWQELSPMVINGRVAGWKVVVEFLAVFYFYPVYLYFNFSGYCDIVIAANRFFGLRLPENFDRPYLARNVLEFWARWHVTLGTWIRDYLFLPMYKPIVQRWPRRAPSLAFLCLFFAFVIAGIWHGSTTNFLVYGLWQGAGAAAAKLWENRLLRRGGRARLREYLQSRRIRLAAVLAHAQFQCLAMLFFPFSTGEALQLLAHVFRAMTGRG